MFDLGSPFDSTIPAGASLLVGGPPLTGKRRLGLDVIQRGLDEGDACILVTTTVTADQVLSMAPFRAEEVAVIDCVTRHLGLSASPTDRLRYASSPEDMTGIGIEFSELVGTVAREGDGLRVVFDSLTPLLVYADIQTVFRFLRVLVSRIETMDALGVFTMDTTAHPDRDVSVVGCLFDGHITTSEDAPATLSLDSDPTPTT
ncbi:RAD55 family ATPase [Halomarina litorea]|uniref:RAD55 family ATPase n=1 Tax=Halomarina litorea TaxID=2961595 RepID=UPI0020C359D3|nr:RAD55 family ATPase [Halomarina sp. BCD28]